MTGQATDDRRDRFGIEFLLGEAAYTKTDSKKRVGQTQGGDAIRGMKAGLEPNCLSARCGALKFDPAKQ